MVTLYTFFVALINELVERVVGIDDIVIEERVVQDWKGAPPILVTELGMTTEDRDLQPLKELLILVTELGIVIE